MEKLDKIIESISDLHRKFDVTQERTNQVYKKVFGNGKRGLGERFDILQGQLSVWKFLTGTSGLGVLSLLVLEAIKRF